MAGQKGFSMNLRAKIAIYILLGAIVFSGAVIFVTSHYLNKTLTDFLVNQGRIIANAIAELAAEKLIEEDVVGMKKILEKYRYSDPHLSNEYILIVDAAHNVVTDTYNGNLPAELQAVNRETARYESLDFSNGQEFSVALITIEAQEVYDILFPIKEGLLGFVRVGLNKSFVDEKVQTTLLYIGFIIALGTLVVILVALLIITVQVTRPVLHLANAANEISLGNFDIPVEIKVKNELQILAAALERMKESLKTSLERLKTRSTIGRF